MRYPKRAYTFSVDYFSTPESVDPELLNEKELAHVIGGK
nr:bacteriocin [Lacticaseibacillus paracasei]